MSRVTAFYNRYHQKNQKFYGVIHEPNFTYWYILRRLHEALPSGFDFIKALDVGCGVGSISLFLAKHGANVKGVDISSRAVQIAKAAKEAAGLENVEFIEGELKQGKAEFDLVTCFEVIEHIPDEQEFAKRLYSQLKPGGKLVLTTPSLQNLLYKIGFYRKFDAEVGHLRRYTPETLKATLEGAGFVILTLDKVEGPIRNILFTTKLGVLIRFIRGPLIPLFHLIDELFGHIFGFSDLQVIAVKRSRKT